MEWRVRSGRIASLVALLILTGCGGATSNSGQSEKVTLIVWDALSGDAADAAARIYADFSEAFPEIEVERHALTDDRSPSDLRIALASGTGPDVLGFVPDAPHRILLEPGLLASLNEIPVRYGWSQKLDPAARQWTTKGGRLFGLPVGVELSGLYVNMSLLERIGQDPPRTYDSLLDLCAVAAQQGITAMALSNDGASGATPLFGMVLNNLVGPDLTAALLFEQWGRWDTSRVARAVRITAEELPRAGCMTTDPAATAEEAIATFGGGETILLPGGSGQAAAIEASTEFETTFIPFPTIDSGRGRVVPARATTAFGLATKSAHPRESAKLLNYLVSDEAAKVWAETGGSVPAVRSNTADWTLSPLTETMLDLTEATRRPFGPDLGYQLDPALPAPFAAAIDESLAAVEAGEVTPELVATRLQMLWLAES